MMILSSLCFISDFYLLFQTFLYVRFVFELNL